jgi:hypothetical protein
VAAATVAHGAHGRVERSYRADLYERQNLFNRTNLNSFSGNQLSPFFGTATSAGPARRIESQQSRSSPPQPQSKLVGGVPPAPVDAPGRSGWNVCAS